MNYKIGQLLIIEGKVSENMDTCMKVEIVDITNTSILFREVDMVMLLDRMTIKKFEKNWKVLETMVSVDSKPPLPTEFT